ncbi:MAG: class I SAM-dependent methyltransferase [Gemmatimonadota bacterium]|nr:class I SAM-dependent methyltransferase [Gemmatimonadota bacterium]
MPKREHWEAVYETKATDAVSWYQPSAARSLALVQRVAPEHDARIIDVGGGASVLVDELLAAGYGNITVLDIAQTALDEDRKRLGVLENAISWVAGDVCDVRLDTNTYDIWHDRAVFHFLTDAADRAAYVRQLRRALKPGGHVVIAAFAEDGPEKCSGLPVVRYSCEAIHRGLGNDFDVVITERELHRTPWGSEQSFVYCVFRRRPPSVIAE